MALSDYDNTSELLAHCWNKLNPQRKSLQMNWNLFSILVFKLNGPDRQTVYHHNPSIDAMEKATKVTREYIKRHHSL